MSGKKIIPSVGERPEKIGGIEVHAFWERGEMRKNDEPRTDENEQSDRFENKRDAPWLPQNEENHRKTEQGGHIVHDPLHSHNGDIVQEEIGDGIARLCCRIETGITIRDKTQHKKNQSDKRR